MNANDVDSPGHIGNRAFLMWQIQQANFIWNFSILYFNWKINTDAKNILLTGIKFYFIRYMLTIMVDNRQFINNFATNARWCASLPDSEIDPTQRQIDKGRL